MTGFEITIAILLGIIAAALIATTLTSINRLNQLDQKHQAASLAQQQLTDLLAKQDTRLTQLNEQLSKSFLDFNNSINQRFTENLKIAQLGQKTVSDRLESTGKTIADVRGQLGELSQSAKQISQIGSDMRKLQDILQSPKLRGGLGEWSLEKLISEILPQSSYHLQYTFKSGTKVDAVIELIEGMICIDAKFPLPNFVALLQAQTPEERQRARKAFFRDVKNRIDEIASKYILPDQGTLDFALMYIPAENVYYEIIAAGDDTDINTYARSRKVIPVSPNTLYAYLMMISAGFKGMQLEKNARLIQGRIADLHQQLTLFTSNFDILGKHLNNASIKYTETHSKLDKIQLSLEKLDAEKPVD